MNGLMTVGALITLAGLAGLGFCVVQVVRARRQGLDDATMRAALRRVVVLNLAALGVSALGLMCVVMGVALLPD